MGSHPAGLPDPGLVGRSPTFAGKNFPAKVGLRPTNPGSDGGPLSTTPSNEQGRILLRYLAKWELLSVHLHTCSTALTHTYTYN